VNGFNHNCQVEAIKIGDEDMNAEDKSRTQSVVSWGPKELLRNPDGLTSDAPKPFRSESQPPDPRS
jgi:hypothetical protein